MTNLVSSGRMWSIGAMTFGTAKFASLVSKFRGGGLGARALRGTMFSMIGYGGENILRLAGNLVLTRLLFPEAFGLLALVQVVMVGLAMFSDIGIRAAIIQDSRGEEPNFLNTVWTVQIVRGFLLWFCTIALAEPVAAFYGDPRLAELLPVVGLAAVFQGFNATRIYSANRALTIGRLTVMNLSAQAFGIVVMIGLAAVTKSYWALVAGMLAIPAMVMVLSHIVLPGIRNRLAFDRDAAYRLFRTGRFIFFSTIASFVLMQADRAVLGKITTLDVVAFYNIGYFLATVPFILMRNLSDSVLFPLVRERPPSEDPDIRRRLNRARIILTGGVMAMSGVLALGGIGIVTLLYDPRYTAGGAMLVIITLAHLPVLMIENYQTAPLARGHPGRFATITIMSAALRVIFMVAGASYFGILGVAVAPAIATVVLYPFMVALIMPYKVWDPRHDALFAAISILLTLAALWLNGDAITATLSVLNESR